MDILSLLQSLRDETYEKIKAAKTAIPREASLNSSPKLIKVAIGMRRSGKSYLLYQTINQLLDKGIPWQQILLINFEDERLLPMTAKEMGQLLDAFYSLHPENHQRQCYIFLDEVQNVQDWHLVVRRYFDSKNTQLYLTGSSAKLLSTEIATSLRGRSLATEVWPYNFREYLLAHGVTPPPQPYGQKSWDIMQQQAMAYLQTGGFPALQELSQDEWFNSLQTYSDLVILRDIIERHQVSNISLLKYLTHHLIKNAASPFSVNKFVNDLRSRGEKLSTDTVHAYLSYLSDAFLTFMVPFYSESIRLQQNRIKKTYVVDNGLIKAHTVGTNAVYNKLLENQVYLDLRRQRKTVYYYKTRDGYEVDFVSVAPSGEAELIQVTWDMSNPQTAEREQRALDQAQDELKLPGRIITFQDFVKNEAP